MTLIMGVSVKDRFVMMSTDSKVVIHQHDSHTFERSSESIRPAKVRNTEKIRHLTDSVLLATSGMYHTGKILKKELKKRVKPGFYLDQCIPVLEKVTSELWSRRKSYEEVGLSDRDSLSLNFIGTQHFGCVLFGFFENGKTGMVYINPGKVEVEVCESPMDQGLNCVIISPSQEDNSNYASWMDLPNNEMTVPNYMYQFLLTHAKLSLKHEDSVSQDCALYGLVKDDKGNIVPIEKTFDSEILHPMFKENPDIDHTKLFKLYKQ